MKKKNIDLVFSCRKCGHLLFLSFGVNMTGGKIALKLKTDCPSCGEEADENWLYVRKGNYDSEYGK